MTYLSEDPTVLAGLLLLLAGGFVVALRVTQQGKYLIRAVIAAAAAAAVVAIEWTWVTDNERIEQVVYGLRQAVANSDVEGVLGYMAPDVMYLRGEMAMEGESTRGWIQANLANARFEIVQISGLETTVAEQARRGTATFRVLAKGTMDTSVAPVNFGTASSSWSLGLRETKPGVWKVYRITPMYVPSGTLAVPGTGGRAARSAVPGTLDDGYGSRRKPGRGGRRIDPQVHTGENADAPDAPQ